MRAFVSLLVLALAGLPLAQCASRHTLEAEADRVRRLPGHDGDLDFGLFGGYITVSEGAGRALFYLFAEARSGAPADAPLVLWLNGGPGCSSLGGGFMSELGPFYPTPGGRLIRNPWAWNDHAHVLFLESPAFVGFSYSNVSADAIVGDARTASDSRVFLLRWLARFPSFSATPLLIAGESYGGHYVPNLADAILQGNARHAARGRPPQGTVAVDGYVEGTLNLQGVFVGNAWTDPAIDNRGALDFWYTHAMIGDDAYQGVVDTCDFSVIGPLARARGGAALLRRPHTPTLRGQQQQPDHHHPHPPDPEWDCEWWLGLAFKQQGDINIYEIYADVCLQDEDAAAPAQQTHGPSPSAAPAPAPRRWRGALLGDQPRWRRRRPAFVAAAASSSSSSPPGGASSGTVGSGTGSSGTGSAGQDPDAGGDGYDPCVDDEVEIYFNRPEVQAAIHANVSGALPGPWTDCTGAISYSDEDLLSSMLPVWRRLLSAGGLKLWVFSGDVDGIVPVLGSRRWVASLQLPVEKGWRTWVSATGQVAGWRIDYSGLTFATVRNAGHMVPYVQPERASALFRDFLAAPTPSPQPAPSSAATAAGASSMAGAARELVPPA